MNEFGALMEAAQNGDKVAYAGLLCETVPLLQRTLRSKAPFLQSADREDVLQEVLLSLHAARATYDPRRPFVPWLMAIVHHRVVDRVRRISKLSANEVLDDESVERPFTEDSTLTDNEYGDAEALRQAVNLLPAGQRAAIELLKFRELSLTEAASVTGMSIGALKASVHRAIKSLRQSLSRTRCHPCDQQGRGRGSTEWRRSGDRREVRIIWSRPPTPSRGSSQSDPSAMHKCALPSPRYPLR